VVTTATPIERNRVNVTFTVVEGDVAKIKDIHIEGAKAFSESTLLDLMDLTTGGWLSWYTKSDRYSRAKLNADLEKVRAYYLNKGYLEFDVKSTQVTISPDKQEYDHDRRWAEGPSRAEARRRVSGQGRRLQAADPRRPGEPYAPTRSRR
jgi:outer membrane protein insertion porin family